VVVVNFGGGLPVAGAEDAPGVLDEPALVGDGRGEEEGVEGGAVEALPGVGAGRDGLPATGGWQTWTTATATVTLPGGQQTLAIDQDNGGWNIHRLIFA
jgi:hypothetical protein